MATKAKTKQVRRRRRLRKQRQRAEAGKALMARARRNPKLEGIYQGRIPGKRKLSEMILELVEPYMDEVSPDNMESLVGLGLIAWNLAVTPPHLRQEFKAEMRRAFRGSRREMEALLGELVERKEELFPDDRRFALDYAYTDDADSGYLQVVSVMDPADLPA